MDFLDEVEEHTGTIMHDNHRASFPGNHWLRDLFDDFVRTLQCDAISRVACLYEQQPTDLGLLLRGRVSVLSDSMFNQYSDISTGQFHL